VTTRHLLASAWQWEPSIVIGCLLLLAFYAVATRLKPGGQATLFALGILVMLLTLVGPLDVLGDEYMFSAHMAEHMLLMFVVPPLLLLGLSRSLMERALSASTVAAVERVLRQAPVAWIIGVGTLWLWHLPVLYNAALASEGVHAVEHLTMMIAGTVLFWPVLSPLCGSRIEVGFDLAYLFTAAAANMLLGVFLSFAAVGAYPLYLRDADGSGIFVLIRDGWGIGPSQDLHLGGLIMWVLGGLIFLVVLVGVFARWYREDAPAVPVEMSR
jgi:cytochrome c oxidase assembly factor CtaG